LNITIPKKLKIAFLIVAVISFLAIIIITIYTLNKTIYLNADTFYSFNDKIWSHANNDTDKAKNSLSKYPGFEFDVIYDEKIDSIYVKHNLEDPNDLELSRFLKNIDYASSHLWMDFKNLNENNANQIIPILDNILDNSEKNRIIIESQNPEALNILSENNFWTSYWIPHFSYSEMSFYTQLRLAIEIGQKVDNYNLNAISAHIELYYFINRFFPDMNVHLWATGKPMEYPKMISEIIDNENVKIILVDD
jgi:thymidylate synthase